MNQIINNRVSRAGKVLVGGIIAMPFIPLNKRSKYSNYPSRKSRFSEWVQCCKE